MFDDTYNFMALKLRRYDIQAAWYTLALHKCFDISEGSNIIKPLSL
jgi:ATP-dependent exoDNAse (exonuclease V) beta subunit